MAHSRSFGAGGLQCVRLTDGELPYPPALLLANAQPDELARALAGELDEEGMIVGRFNPLLIRAPDAVVLVDTGIGRFASSEGAGLLHESLGREGVEPGDVDCVVLTHAHPDHLGGLINGGDPVFTRARHVILAAEWEFWAEAGDRVPDPIAVGFKEAEWTSAIDIDPELAVESRRRLLERAADEELLVAGYHLGRNGYVERDGEAF